MHTLVLGLILLSASSVTEAWNVPAVAPISPGAAAGRGRSHLARLTAKVRDDASCPATRRSMLKGSVGAAVGFWSPSMAKAAGQTSTAVLDSTWSTEINGQLLEKGGECKGARGNDCDVWIPPEIPDSPEELVGEIGVVTSKVFLDLRILKDYNKEVLEDGAVRGRLVIGLYGNDAPKTVAHFLQFFPKIYGEGPAYATGSFFRHEPGKYLEGIGHAAEMMGLRVLAGGKISGLFPTQLAGSDSYEWNGGVYPLKAPLEANDLRHDRKNLLSHKKFNAGPEFDVLLSPCGELDGSNTVFGEVLAGEELLLEMAQLPFVTGKSLDPSGSVASNIWAAQNQYFRGLAKSLGDTRVQKTFPGKLLRRVEITKAGVLNGEEDDDEADASVPTPESALKGSLQRQLFEIKRKKQKQEAQDAEAARLLSE